jgi:hypothetical protein
MFRVVLPPIIRSECNCIYSIWYLSHRYCYLPLSWKSWNRFERAVGGVGQIAVTVWQIPDAVYTVVCTPDDGWKYHPKHVKLFPHINKLCNFASSWIYSYNGLLLGARPILHISMLRVKILQIIYRFIRSTFVGLFFIYTLFVRLMRKVSKLSLISFLWTFSLV